MGLDTSHDCWHGAYSTFAKWREAIAEASGMTLGAMEGFGGLLPWPQPPEAIHLLLNHSDCDGSLRWQDCGAIADALEALRPKLSDEFDRMAQQFIEGLRRAAKAKQNVEFY